MPSNLTRSYTPDAHDVGLVHHGDLGPPALLGKLKGILADAQRSFSCDELDALHHTGYHLVLNTTVLALGIFTNNDCVHIYRPKAVSQPDSTVPAREHAGTENMPGRTSLLTFVRGDIALNGATRSDIGKEVKGLAQSEVEGRVALTNGRAQRALRTTVSG